MNIYTTENFPLSAYLVAVGMKLIDHKREGGSSTFMFEDTEELRNLTSDYFAFKAVINPVLLSSSYRHLKNVMYKSETPHHEQLENNEK